MTGSAIDRPSPSFNPQQLKQTIALTILQEKMPIEVIDRITQLSIDQVQQLQLELQAS